MGTTVLVVDDSARMRTLVTRALEEQGFEVATAWSGAEALARLATTSYVAACVAKPVKDPELVAAVGGVLAGTSPPEPRQARRS